MNHHADVMIKILIQILFQRAFIKRKERVNLPFKPGLRLESRVSGQPHRPSALGHSLGLQQTIAGVIFLIANRQRI